MKYKCSGDWKPYYLEYTESIQQLQLRPKPGKAKEGVIFREVGFLGESGENKTCM